jgi:hypothetical protein
MIPNSSKSLLAVRKSIAQIALIDRSYQLGVMKNDSDGMEHDLCVMHDFRDLAAVALELIGEGKVVLFAYRIRFDRSRDAAESENDAARGLELPIFDRQKVLGNRLLITRHGRHEQYAHLLQLAWTKADALKQRTSDTLSSSHTRKISGGRMHSTFDLPADARHLLEITRAGGCDFAFARDLTMDAPGVYLHQQFAPHGFTFRSGDLVSAVVVQTPRGLQARNILPA